MAQLEPFFLLELHHSIVVSACLRLVRPSHGIMVLHNTECLHQLSLLLQDVFLGLAAPSDCNLLRELGIVAKDRSNTLEVRMRREISRPVCTFN